jgi:hypothetical protein
MSMLLTLLFTCLAYFGLPLTKHSVQESVYDYGLFSEHLSNHWQGLRTIFPNISTKFDAVLLSDPSRSRIRPVTRLQIKGRKN